MNYIAGLSVQPRCTRPPVSDRKKSSNSRHHWVPDKFLWESSADVYWIGTVLGAWGIKKNKTWSLLPKNSLMGKSEVHIISM